jgi:hypothetical protein
MLPSRQAALKCNGRFVTAGRASFVFETFLMRRAAGVPGVYEIARGERGSPWHRLDWTMEEAEAALASGWKLSGARRVRQAHTTREARRQQGLPVR